MSETTALGTCEAIEGYFVWGVQRCGRQAVTEAIDATWGSIHPVCAEHTPADVAGESEEN